MKSSIGCFLLGLLFLLAASTFASPVAPDTTQAAPTSAVVDSVADPLPGKRALTEVKPVAADKLPEVNPQGDGDAGNNLAWWQGINASINEISSWLVVLGVIASLIAWPIGVWRKRKHRQWPHKNEQKAYDAMIEIQKFAQRKQPKLMATFVKEECQGLLLGGTPPLIEISRQWGQIVDRMNDLNRKNADLSDRERNQKWKEIISLSKSAKKKLKANFKL